MCIRDSGNAGSTTSRGSDWRRAHVQGRRGAGRGPPRRNRRRNRRGGGALPAHPCRFNPLPHCRQWRRGRAQHPLPGHAAGSAAMWQK
eukprot:5818253-Alexandrium_andersonii.AAC.1